jgi:transcription elongation factor Elf1
MEGLASTDPGRDTQRASTKLSVENYRHSPSRSHHAPVTPGSYHRVAFVATSRRPVKEEEEMKIPSRETSKPNSILFCPACGHGELGTRGLDLAERDSCGHNVEGAILKTLEQIVALPDAFGELACECGNPEMRRLPDSVFHCPACSSEVVSLVVGATRTANSGNPQK